MYSFKNWLSKNHPELLEEDAKKTAGALVLGLASLLPSAGVKASEPNNVASVSQKASYQTRLDAMLRVSSVHRFKKNWGSKFGQKEDKALFDAILKLQTEKDHDDLLEKITKDKENAFLVQMQGRFHPDKDIEKSEKKMINSSYSFQYMDYVKALVLASKINL
jgi:hypothetical protein